ncbi:MAG: DUF1737 domain-containing protein [Candidatus Thalassarchaeaceae archaeon]|nr:DUF1737 domain-containing protein [Candidatus Thalassarchaeaceae archaeon]
MTYKIVTGSAHLLAEFEYLIQEWIEKGWTPLGAPFVTTIGGTQMYQAMTKDD